MWRRWIIRTFFLGLVLLCAGGWVQSYRYAGDVSGFWGAECLEMASLRGTLYLGLVHAPSAHAKPGVEWDLEMWEVAVEYTTETSGHHALGFALGTTHDPDRSIWFLGQPYWFLTLLSAGVLFVAWRKTALPKPARGFPVEQGACRSEPRLSGRDQV